jgi:hypothetical protein
MVETVYKFEVEIVTKDYNAQARYTDGEMQVLLEDALRYLDHPNKDYHTASLKKVRASKRVKG